MRIGLVLGASLLCAFAAACSSEPPPVDHPLDANALGDDTGSGDAFGGTTFCEDDPGALCPTSGSACTCTGSTMCLLFDGGPAFTVTCTGGAWCSGDSCAAVPDGGASPDGAALLDGGDGTDGASNVTDANTPADASVPSDASSG